MENEVTDVIFRVWEGKNGGDVIAIFPSELGNLSASTCSSYEHFGQHGPCDPTHVIQQTRPATQDEYRPLERELASIGYSMRILRRLSPKHRMDRIAKLKRIA